MHVFKVIEVTTMFLFQSVGFIKNTREMKMQEAVLLQTRKAFVSKLEERINNEDFDERPQVFFFKSQSN